MEKFTSLEQRSKTSRLMTIEYYAGYSYFDRLIAHDAIFPAASQQGHAHQLFAQDIGENERCHDGGV